MSIEGLLNKLIEKGWKPFNKDIKGFSTLNEFTCGYRGEGTNHLGTIRSIVTKESGLWQFVCENGMVDDGVEYKGYALVYVDGGAIAKYETGCRYLYSNIEPEFYIMESALCDESELEQFLLDNIKV